jgi:hypothetical protein
MPIAAKVPTAKPTRKRAPVFNFAAAVTQAIKELGAREGSAYGWQIDTRAGLLQLSPYEDWVACRFEDVARANVEIRHGQLNPHSGKWNWYFDKPDAADVERFKQQIGSIVEVAHDQAR